MADNKRLKWWSSPRVVFRHIVMQDDTPHSIALGTAVGMFIGLTPTVGVQMILVMIFAFLTYKLFYFNRVAALLTVYISNPLTMLPIYWFDYKIGTLFIAGDAKREEFGTILEYDGFREWWNTVLDLFVLIGEPLIIGALVVGTTGSVVAYPTMRWLVRWFQGKPPGGAGDLNDSEKTDEPLTPATAAR